MFNFPFLKKKCLHFRFNSVLKFQLENNRKAICCTNINTKYVSNPDDPCKILSIQVAVSPVNSKMRLGVNLLNVVTELAHLNKRTVIFK